MVSSWLVLSGALDVEVSLVEPRQSDRVCCRSGADNAVSCATMQNRSARKAGRTYASRLGTESLDRQWVVEEKTVQELCADTTRRPGESQKSRLRLSAT